MSYNPHITIFPFDPSATKFHPTTPLKLNRELRRRDLTSSPIVWQCSRPSRCQLAVSSSYKISQHIPPEPNEQSNYSHLADSIPSTFLPDARFLLKSIKMSKIWSSNRRIFRTIVLAWRHVFPKSNVFPAKAYKLSAKTVSQRLWKKNRPSDIFSTNRNRSDKIQCVEMESNVFRLSRS